MTLEQYEWHVWDMAKNVVHVPAIYAVAQVVGLTRLLPHPWFQQPGAGLWREIAVFVCGFLGAWAVFYSTLLRDAGLRSWTVTFLVPAAVLVAIALWAFFPPVDEMSATTALVGAALLAGPGPVGWVVTMRRWRIERRRAADLLEGARPW